MIAIIGWSDLLESLILKVRFGMTVAKKAILLLWKKNTTFLFSGYLDFYVTPGKN